ncbi:MAG TPA: glycosyltransferase, partial [Candidatus Dormibacteraeota bacterium]|nr:glycosyltransferase [Candidatus Dormibacteraeota bacterium]
HTAFDRRAGQAPFDAVVYQVGCSMHHAYMAGAIAAHPGITVLHELAWSPVMYIDAKLRDGTAEFRRLLAEAEGDAAVRRLDEAEAAGGEPSRCLFDYPMLGRLVRPGLAQIVHTAAAARELASRFPEARPHVIPLGIVDPLATDPPIDRDAARRTIGAGDSTFVIGVFGALHPVKRPEECVHAVRELGERGVDSLLLVVGRPLPGDQYVEELETLAKELGVRERVRLVGHAGDRAFDEHLVAADVVVNLQVPTANHMSGVVIRALAAGTPVVITDDPRWSELPDGCCFRVPPVDAGGASLADVLEALARDADLLSTAGRHARRYHETTTAWHLAAARYLEVIREVAGAGATPAPSPDAPKALVRCG